MTDEQEKRRIELIDKAILDDTPILFAVSPGMSWPTPEMVAAAPEFWKVKPAASAVPKTKKAVPVSDAQKTPPKQ